MNNNKNYSFIGELKSVLGLSAALLGLAVGIFLICVQILNVGIWNSSLLGVIFALSFMMVVGTILLCTYLTCIIDAERRRIELTKAKETLDALEKQ
jgi:hypothetical protein